MASSETPARDAVLVKYLNEAYGKEKQLETALQAQITLAKRPQLKKGLQDHLKVTKAQARGLEKRIKQLGGKAEMSAEVGGPDIAASAAGAVANLANRALALAKGPMQAARGTSEADNELRNVRDCYWNEAEEIAHYNVIEAVANELGDRETAKLAKQYRREEERMQALLERQIPPLVKAVVKEEVPSGERRASSGRRSSRSGGTRRTTSRSSSGSSSSRSRGSSSSGRRSGGTSRARSSGGTRRTAASSGSSGSGGSSSSSGS